MNLEARQHWKVPPDIENILRAVSCIFAYVLNQVSGVIFVDLPL